MQHRRAPWGWAPLRESWSPGVSSRILIVGMVVAVLLSIVQAAHAEGRRFLRLGVTADGGGYLLASTRGEFYAYGNAHPWPNPTGFAGEITSVAVTANGQGAAALSSIGQVYAYGTVQHRGNGDFGCTRYGGANVCLEIREKYESLGGPRSFLGIPTSHEFPAGGGRGLGMHFQGGSIYWSKETGAHEVRGAIREKWGSLGWENGFLGFPTSDEFSAGGGRGRGNHFQGGSIYWSAPTGAHEVHGAIREKWGSLGWENGFLGFPTSDEYSSYGGQVRVSDFIGGSVYWSSTGGAADYVPASVTGFRSWHSTEPPPGRLLYNYDFAIPSGQAKPIYASPSKHSSRFAHASTAAFRSTVLQAVIPSTGRSSRCRPVRSTCSASPRQSPSTPMNATTSGSAPFQVISTALTPR
jgi:hypothetical protein